MSLKIIKAKLFNNFKQFIQNSNHFKTECIVILELNTSYFKNWISN